MDQKQIEQFFNNDKLLATSIKLFQQENTVSASLLQRKLCIGFPRAMQIIEALEQLEVISKPEDGDYKRQLLEIDEKIKKYIEQ